MPKIGLSVSGAESLQSFVDKCKMMRCVVCVWTNVGVWGETNIFSLSVRLVIAIIGVGSIMNIPRNAQVPIADPLLPPSYSNVPVPSQLELTKLVWSIMVEVQHSNISGNYSVLRNLSAPAFQIQNYPARLTNIFSSLRKQNIDQSNTLFVAPSFTAPPRMVQPDVMRIVGFLH